MNGKARRIFLACALGAMTGLYVAIILPGPVWWLGALIGGFLSGFLYALRDIIRYTPIASRTAWRGPTYAPMVWHKIQKASALEKWETALTVMFTTETVILLWLTFSNIPNRLVIGFGMLYFLVIMMVSFVAVISIGQESEKARIRRIQKATFYITPPGMIVLAIKTTLIIVKATLMIVIEGICSIATFIATIATFLKNLFIFIHSRELVLCMVDGGLGVVISYLLFVGIGNLPLGPTLLSGGLIGGLLGTIDYEVVSKRLHLVN